MELSDVDLYLHVNELLLVLFAHYYTVLFRYIRKIFYRCFLALLWRDLIFYRTAFLAVQNSSIGLIVRPLVGRSVRHR